MFYDQVKALCQTRNIAITALARQLHLSPSAPNNWKEGTLPKADTIMKISDFFGVSTDFLLYGKDRSSDIGIASHGAAVLQRASGNSVSVSAGVSGQNDDLQGFEAELIRIYRMLDLKAKSELIQCAFSLEEKAKAGDSV